MKLAEILPFLHNIAPLELAEDWDNVGLLTGDPQQDIKKVILTIDLTAEVLEEAKQKRANLILAYHPPIFSAIKKVLPDKGTSPLLYEVIRNGMAIYSMHTALDMAEGGINDLLAGILGITNPQPLAKTSHAESGHYKVVVFVPVNEFETVSDAMFAAGAGVIGENAKYTKCSYRVDGTGTFECGSDSNPSIGTPGSYEEVNEYRLETIVPKARLNDVLNAMVAAHSYEEVAYDIYPLVQNVTHGLGRFGILDKPTKVADLIAEVKKQLKIDSVGLIGSPKAKVTKAAVGAGSCGCLISDVIAVGCDFFMTGELKHHDALQLQAAGVTTICTSHSNSERIILKRIAKQIKKEFKQLDAFVSIKDKDPFKWI